MVKPADHVSLWRRGGWPRLASLGLPLVAIVLMIALTPPWFVVLPVACASIASLVWGHRRFRQQLRSLPGLENPPPYHPLRGLLVVFCGLLMLHFAASVGAPDWLILGLPAAALAGVVTWLVIKLRRQRRR